MNTKSCFAPAHILLPSEQIPLEKWGCIACDQFTSDRDYWQKAEAAAVDAQHRHAVPGHCPGT